MITFLSGGTGTPKLLMGMQGLLPSGDICVIANTGEDTTISGIYLSPDVDSVIYSLAGIIDKNVWYGVEGDTFYTHDALRALGHEELLRIGDRDRATKVLRTLMLGQGRTLTEATERIRKGLGVEELVFPMTDDSVRTSILTEGGEMAFHDYWVRDRAEHRVIDIEYRGSEDASMPLGAQAAMESSDAIIIGPSNPITSIMPILSIKGIREMCRSKKVVAVSPFSCNTAFSGPAARLMADLGHEASPLGLAGLYGDFLDCMVIDERDRGMTNAICHMGIDVLATNIAMKGLNTSKTLGKDILDFLVID